MSEAKCQICGEPMPAGEEMFFYHGYSGPCPKPPLPKAETPANVMTAEWKPIATAPRDGTWVLLWWPHWFYQPMSGYYGLDGWQMDRALLGADDPGPTHWCPLPSPPTEPPE